MKRKKSEHVVGKYHITVEFVVDDSSRLHDYGFDHSKWHRGVKLMKHFGSDRALELMDLKAERAFRRGDVNMCRKWRDLMGVIHAVEADEPQPNDRIH